MFGKPFLLFNSLLGKLLFGNSLLCQSLFSKLYLLFKSLLGKLLLGDSLVCKLLLGKLSRRGLFSFQGGSISFQQLSRYMRTISLLIRILQRLTGFLLKLSE